MKKFIVATGALVGLVLGLPSAALGSSPQPGGPLAGLRVADAARTADLGPPPAPDLGSAVAGSVLGTDDPGVIRDRYIVTFRKGTSSAAVRAARDLARAGGATIHLDYSSALEGFAATLPAQAVDALGHNPAVELIEPDRVITVATTQTQATFGLDRVDQRNLPLDSSYTYDTTGQGVTAYVIDTGIRTTHAQFGGGRAVSGFDAIDGSPADDCNGHGTHVAGTIGGSTYGVAKEVRLVAVRVLDCNGSGTTSAVISGVDWVTMDHQAGQAAVANMSLWGDTSNALDTAVRNSSADGVMYAIAAGNNNGDACGLSPARVAEALTVGSTTASDARSSFSNYGSCLDLFAPGSGITSAWSTSDTATNTISGTSMATPHVAGIAALYLQAAPSSSPQQVRDAIVNGATSGVVTNPGSGSPNRLVYSRLQQSPPPPPPPPPPPATCAAETYTGTLSGTGDADLQPNGTYFQAVAGTHQGCLSGPASSDFDLALYRWSGSQWSRVAVSQGVTSTESIAYNGTAGYYYWRVYSYSGSGSYTLKIKRP